MRISDIPGILLEDTVRKVRRVIIGSVVIGASGLVIIVEGIAAGRLALEPVVGPVGARLVLIAVFALIAIVAAFVFLRDAKAAAAAAQPAAGRSSTEERIAIIAEAIGLGYSLARDFSKTSQTNGAADPDARRPAEEDRRGAEDARAP